MYTAAILCVFTFGTLVGWHGRRWQCVRGLKCSEE